MIAVLISAFAMAIPVILVAYEKINSLQKRVHDLHIKELMLNHRTNVLEETVKQIDVNIMTLSLDMHAYEKKCENLLSDEKNNTNIISRRIDKIENQISTMRERRVI